MNDNFGEIKMTDENETAIQEEQEIQDGLKRAYTKTMMDKTLGINQTSDREQQIRLEALKIALEIAFKTCHFDHEYKSKDKFFDHLEQVYEIAGGNLKFLRGEK